MAAGFAKNYEADHLERGAHEISSRAAASAGQPGRDTRCWITRHSIARSPPVWRAMPDRGLLAALCRGRHQPFGHCLELIQSGLVWQAVRASSAIPGLLPPFYTKGGTMLVDGCLIDNVPLEPMHQ
jgi:Predicted esterase of the alpha-beta hydrolase superfamily